MRRRGRLFALFSLVTVGVAVAPLGAAMAAGVKLPKRLTTPTGNFITLYGVKTEGSLESADVEVCASAHTPKGSAVVPVFFTLKLTSGPSVHLTMLSPKSPALHTTPIAPNHCVRGWITFVVPHGAHPSALVYTYGTPISWQLS